MMKVTRLKSAGAANYYAKDDYYLQRDEGGVLTWGGLGARTLGLKGPVEAADLRVVLEGYNPDPNGPALSWPEEQARRGITIEETEDCVPASAVNGCICTAPSTKLVPQLNSISTKTERCQRSNAL